MTHGTPAAQTAARQFASSFTRATGIPLSLHPPGQFEVGESPEIPPLCRLLAAGALTAERCRNHHLSLQDPAGKQTRTAACYAGLSSSAVPVESGGVLRGYLHLGHVWLGKKSCCGTRGQGCRLIGAACHPKRRPACAGACGRVPVLDPIRYQGALELATHLSLHLAALPWEEHHTPWSGCLTRVVEALRSDLARPWSLADAAALAGMHPHYFCERFRQFTGETFSRFLTRLRVERARTLLTYTALPISDIAFASGFRSLSQFNRSFKLLTGHPPSHTPRHAIPAASSHQAHPLPSNHTKP